MAIIKCRECGMDISSEARTCPHCGCPSEKQVSYQKRADQNASSSRVLFVIIGVILMLAGFAVVFSGF